MRDQLRSILNQVSRRGFLGLGAMSAAGLALPSAGAGESITPAAIETLTPPSTGAATMIGVPFERKNPRIGIVGVGGRGTSLLQNLLAADAQVVAICDLVKEHADHAQSMVAKAGKPAAELYTGSETIFEKLTARNDLDLVITATPWKWHVPVAVSAMKNGHHAATEVPSATTLEDCWKLVETSEKTRRHCMMMENCCYGYTETLVLRMIHAGLFGEIYYGEGAYLHDLREILFSNEGEGLWRRTEHTLRNGNLYPTHGLGPVANYMGIQRGDRFDYIVSMSTPPRGLEIYRQEHIAKSDPRWSEKYITGDMNTSLIKTAKGRTITVKFDVVNPRPYDRINAVSGTKGTFIDYPPRIYFDGQEGGEKYGTIDAYKEHQHPLWKTEGEIAQKLGGHGGMDFIMLYRILQCFKEGLPPDFDVYDAAAWSAPTPLSRLSVQQGSAPVKFPDFTRGQWQKRSASAIATQS